MAQTGMVNGSDADGVFSNDSHINASCCPVLPVPVSTGSNTMNFRFSLGFSMICSLNIAVACASIFTNSLLLWAISRVDNSVLKAKRFIINSSVSNIVLPVLFALDPYFISSLIHMNGNIISPNICGLGVYITIGFVVFCTQACCVIGLASDRIYAVARPLIYGTTGYTRVLRLSFLIMPWFIALTIFLIAFVVTWLTSPASEIPGVPIFCVYLVNAYVKAEGSKVVDIFITGANVFSFVVYMSIFVIIKCKQRTIQNMSMTTAKRTTLSLARTYFMVNVTTLALYLPAPLFSLIYESVTGENITEESAYVGSSLMLLYNANTFMDPLILMSRIPSIRSRLPIKFKPSSKQHDKTQINGGFSVTQNTKSTSGP